MACCQCCYAGDAIPPLANAQAPAAKNNAGAKWNEFWQNFTTAIDKKDKAAITAITSPEFYDGGGATIAQWLDAEVFANEKTFQQFKTLLKKPVKTFKGFDRNPYKATGKNKSGDLFFQFKNDKWLFGGTVGD